MFFVPATGLTNLFLPMMACGSNQRTCCKIALKAAVKDPAEGFFAALPSGIGAFLFLFHPPASRCGTRKITFWRQRGSAFFHSATGAVYHQAADPWLAWCHLLAPHHLQSASMSHPAVFLSWQMLTVYWQLLVDSLHLHVSQFLCEACSPAV